MCFFWHLFLAYLPGQLYNFICVFGLAFFQILYIERIIYTAADEADDTDDYAANNSGGTPADNLHCKAHAGSNDKR